MVRKETPEGADEQLWLRSENRFVLSIALGLNAAMFVVGLVAGEIGQSSGLIADSLDMFADGSVLAGTRGSPTQWQEYVAIKLGGKACRGKAGQEDVKKLKNKSAVSSALRTSHQDALRAIAEPSAYILHEVRKARNISEVDFFTSSRRDVCLPQTIQRKPPVWKV